MMSRETLTNIASHVRRVAQRYRLLGTAVRRLDEVRHPELRQCAALLSTSQRLRQELQAVTHLDAVPDLLLSDGDVWLRRDTAWFQLRPETVALVVGTFEPVEARFLAESVEPNGRFVDIGANFGLHSVLLSTRFPDLTVDAFEPVPTTLEMLRANAARNGCKGLRIHACAVSDADGEVMITTQLATGNHLVSSARSAVHPFSLRVPAITLDSFWQRQGNPPVDLVKVDVEGAEWHVLRGGAAFFSRRPLLMIELAEEWLRRFDHTIDECIVMLGAYGYRYARPIGVGRDAEWTDLSTLRTRSSGNYVFSPRPLSISVASASERTPISPRSDP